jgi:hypothetical protein
MFVLEADVCEAGAGDALVMETTRIAPAAAAIAVAGLTRRYGVATAVDVPFAAPRRDRDRAPRRHPPTAVAPGRGGNTSTTGRCL